MQGLVTSGFVRGAQEALWEDGFKHFAALPPDSKGRRVVVQEHTSADGFRVGAWLHTQRTLHRKGEFTPHPTPPYHTLPYPTLPHPTPPHLTAL